MSIPFVPPSGQPILVDEVDSVVEFSDSCLPGARAEGSGEPKRPLQPVLTDVVDQVVEFVDPAQKPTNQPLSPTNGSVFVDTVDRIEEFVDRPLKTSVEV